MEKITAKAEYNEKNIKKLAVVLDKSFFGKKRTIQLLCCAFAIIFFMSMGINSTTSMLGVALAGLILGTINHRATAMAKETLKSLGNTVPVVEYEFFPEHVTVHAGKNVQNLDYTLLIRLIEDGKMLYLCPSPANAFMVSCDSMSAEQQKELKKTISLCTGLEWQRTDRIFHFNRSGLFKKQ